MIFLDIFNSANIVLQVIGRIFCLRQQFPQKIWIAMTDHIYDQVVQIRAANKIISQITDQKNVEITEEEIKTALDLNQNENEAEVQQTILLNKCICLYTQMFDQCDSHHLWTDFKNLYIKDNLRDLSLSEAEGKDISFFSCQL